MREQVLAAALSWLGANEGSAMHHYIIDLYNSHRPLARGYKVTYKDEWCATFVSAVAIKCGLTDIMPTECGCEKMINLYMALGRWIEDDAYIPQPGDIIFYDWQDNGAGDNTGTADHVGIVEYVADGIVHTIEGNVGDTVGRRTVKLNGRYIRGYAVPDYEEVSMKKGIDISNHNSNLDYAAMAKQIEYAIIKVSEGTFFVDPLFEEHHAGFKAQGIPCGAYVFTHADSAEKGKAEAEYALKLLNGRYLELPVFTDIEASVIQSGSAACMEGALAFGEAIKAAGYRWGVYASASKFATGFLDIPTLRAAGAVIWCAQYNTVDMPKVDYDIWQYTSTWKLVGDVVDGNRMLNDVIVPEPERDLSDVADWARDAANLLIDADIIHGDPDGKLRGYDNVTRNELFVALANMLNR